MMDDMVMILKRLEKVGRVIDELDTEYDRLQYKLLTEGLTEKEQIQFEVLEHLKSAYK